MSQTVPQRNFWSDRKARVLAEEQAEEHAAVAVIEATDLAAQEAKSDEALLEEQRRIVQEIEQEKRDHEVALRIQQQLDKELR